MTEGNEDFFANLAIESDPEPLPTLVGGGRAAIEVPAHFMQAIRHSYTLLNDGKGAEAVQRILIPVKASEMEWKDQTTKTKDKDGNEVPVVVKWQHHPMVTRSLTILRRAAEKEGLGVRIVVDRKDTEDGSKALAVKGGNVRIRFVGMKRKERKATDKPSA